MVCIDLASIIHHEYKSRDRIDSKDHYPFLPFYFSDNLIMVDSVEVENPDTNINSSFSSIMHNLKGLKLILKMKFLSFLRYLINILYLIS